MRDFHPVQSVALLQAAAWLALRRNRPGGCRTSAYSMGGDDSHCPSRESHRTTSRHKRSCRCACRSSRPLARRASLLGVVHGGALNFPAEIKDTVSSTCSIWPPVEQNYCADNRAKHARVPYAYFDC